MLFGQTEKVKKQKIDNLKAIASNALDQYQNNLVDNQITSESLIK